MIDITKPLQLADGTPVGPTVHDDSPWISVKVHGLVRSFHAMTGKHCSGALPNLQNVPEVPSKETTVPASRPFDPTKPVQTRDGRKARIICSDRAGPSGNYPIVALFGDSESLETYTADGRSHSEQTNARDLVNVPERTERFVNVYRPVNDGFEDRSFWHKDADAAQRGRPTGRNANPDRVTTIQITYEDDKPVAVSLVP